MIDLLDSVTIDLLNDVTGCAERTHVRLRDAGHDDLAQALYRQLRSAPDATPTVVVVGETKRGKSSVVNTLLGRPGLSPVDVDVATCVHIGFHYAVDEGAQVSIAGSECPTPIELADLAEWAAEAGNPGNSKGVVGVDVGLPVRLLHGLNLIDTPGVGGLELGHAELTLQALGSADALLFIIDAGAPISATELAFLRRAAERIDTVVFVLSKIDLYPGWRQILADNQALLHQHAPRFAGAPMLPISSRNAERALALPAGSVADLERRRSGLDALESVLSGFVTDRARLLGAANTMRFTLRAIAELHANALDQVATATGDPARDRELAAEQARLAELAPREAHWRRQLDSDIAKLALYREVAVRALLDDRAREYLDLGAKCRTPAEFQALSGQFVAAVDAGTRRIAEQTADELIAAVTRVIEFLADDPMLRASLARVAGGAESSGRDFAPAAQKRLTGIELFTAVTPLLSIDRLLTIVPSTLGFGLVATGPIGIGIGLAALTLGGGAAMILSKERKKVAAQASFANWVREFVAVVRDSEQRAFALAMIDARRDLAAALDDGVARRAADVARDRARLSAAQSESATHREIAGRQARGHLAAVDALNREAQELLRRLHQTRTDAAAGPTSTPSSVPERVRVSVPEPA
jgi:hypothetical protein